MHKKAKTTFPSMESIPAVITAQGFHKGRFDFLEESVIHENNVIVVNASSREVFHRRRLALPSSPATSTTPHSPSSLNSPVKGEQDEKDEMEEKVPKNAVLLLSSVY